MCIRCVASLYGWRAVLTLENASVQADDNDDEEPLNSVGNDSLWDGRQRRISMQYGAPTFHDKQRRTDKEFA